MDTLLCQLLNHEEPWFGRSRSSSGWDCSSMRCPKVQLRVHADTDSGRKFPTHGIAWSGHDVRFAYILFALMHTWASTVRSNHNQSVRSDGLLWQDSKSRNHQKSISKGDTKPGTSQNDVT